VTTGDGVPPRVARSAAEAVLLGRPETDAAVSPELNRAACSLPMSDSTLSSLLLRGHKYFLSNQIKF